MVEGQGGPDNEYGQGYGSQYGADVAQVRDAPEFVTESAAGSAVGVQAVTAGEGCRVGGHATGHGGHQGVVVHGLVHG